MGYLTRKLHAVFGHTGRKRDHDISHAAAACQMAWPQLGASLRWVLPPSSWAPSHTWTAKVCQRIAFGTILRGFRPSFYKLFRPGSVGLQVVMLLCVPCVTLVGSCPNYDALGLLSEACVCKFKTWCAIGVEPTEFLQAIFHIGTFGGVPLTLFQINMAVESLIRLLSSRKSLLRVFMSIWGRALQVA